LPPHSRRTARCQDDYTKISPRGRLVAAESDKKQEFAGGEQGGGVRALGSVRGLARGSKAQLSAALDRRFGFLFTAGPRASEESTYK
jgi:hypothetical protein